jgi:hypothetical protein
MEAASSRLSKIPYQNKAFYFVVFYLNVEATELSVKGCGILVDGTAEMPCNALCCKLEALRAAQVGK